MLIHRKTSALQLPQLSRILLLRQPATLHKFGDVPKQYVVRILDIHTLVRVVLLERSGS